MAKTPHKLTNVELASQQEHRASVRKARYASAKRKGATAKEARASSGHGSESESEKLDEFRFWSSKEGEFPREHLREIRSYNRAHHKTRDDHLGYRAFYWKYVYGIDDKEFRKSLIANNS